MRLYVCFSLFVLSFALTGCGTTAKVLAAGVVPTSKYVPLLTSADDVDDFVKLVKPVSGEVVSDELGTYYFKLDGNIIYSTSLLKQDESALRALMSNAVGLMEPMYTFDTNGQIVVDWKASERRHAYLRNELKLKLLPLEETKKYAKIVRGYSSAQNKNNGAFPDVGKIFAGNRGLYNSDYSKNILSKISGEFNYVLLSALTKTFAYEYSPPKNDYQMYAELSTAVRSINDTSNQILQFVPKIYFDELEKGGDFRFFSSCYGLNIDVIKSGYNLVDAYNSIPKKGAELNNAIASRRQELVSLLTTMQLRQLESEKACKLGLQALQVSGKIESKKLK
jgi:hypothetical protein